jgi:hypothetical protein
MLPTIVVVGETSLAISTGGIAANEHQDSGAYY